MRRSSRLHIVAAVVLAGCITAISPPINSQAALPDVPTAIQSGVNDAAGYGITQYVAVIDRSSGQLIGSTANLDVQVASESIFKLLLAAFLLRQNGGAFPNSAMDAEMRDMIVRSNDSIASKYWSADAVPVIASLYGLSNTTNPTDRIGHWGAVRITARDMATFLWRMSQDPLVGPWLLTAMSSTLQIGADQEFQGFGFNSLSGTHGSKQGWGCDSFWVGPCAINSVGFSDTIMGAVLQTAGPAQYNTMKSTSTTTVRLVVDAAVLQPPSLPGRDNPEGAFAMSVDNNGRLGLDGWAFDGSSLLATVDVVIRANGVPVLEQNASGPRPELATFGIPGNHGFAGGFTLSATGVTQLCMYVRNIGAGADQLVQCSDINFMPNPVRDNPRGAFSASVSEVGNISIDGWAFDPNSVGLPINVMITVDGELVALLAATGPRPELIRFGVPGNHGFTANAMAKYSGNQRICLYAANLGWGAGQWVQCINLPFSPDPAAVDPRGAFNVSKANGRITVKGWTFDPSSLAAPINVMVTVNGDVKALALAQGPRPELVNFGVPGNHGFNIVVAGTVETDQVCLFAFNIGIGTNQLVGCRSS